MINQARAQDGVSVAVVPLRVLAEKDGVLDALEAQGLDISGPEWRTTPVALPAQEPAPAP